MTTTRHLILIALATLLLTPAAGTAEPVPEEWLTPAEKAEFRATPSYDDTLAFLRRLEAQSPFIHLGAFGTSAQGREMPLVVVSKDGAFTAEAAGALGKPIVMIQNGIHSGEIDGKDACLMLLRDLALGRRDALVDGVTLLILPIYNVDGHERVSLYNRPNQDGPVEGMGFRTTAAGYDLNRDHLKLETEEARALVRLVDAWHPHIHVDNHVTDGSDHDWVFTWSRAEAPQLAEPVSAWLDEHFPKMLAATAAAGHRNGPYVGLNARSDPSQGFSSWAGEPRYSGGYFPLRHTPSILVEMHSYKPYRQRVLAVLDFVAALIEETGRAGKALTEAIAAAEAATVALGRPGAEPSEVVTAWGAHDTGDTIRWPVYEWEAVDSQVFGAPLLDYRRGEIKGDDPAGIEVPWTHTGQAEHKASRPRGYLVLPGWPQIEDRLRWHGLETVRLEQPLELEVQSIRLSGAQFSPQPYQGRHRIDRVAGERLRHRYEAPQGALWVPADQPLFEIAVQLIEPEGPDSLLSWGMLSTIFERKEYIEPRTLEKYVSELPKDDPLWAEWESELKDKAFADAPRARLGWWHRNTPYWDASINLMPVLRVVELPEELKR